MVGISDSNVVRSFNRVLIECVTLEVKQSVEPVKILRSDKVYLIHYVEEGVDETRKEREALFIKAFNAVRDQIKSYGAEVLEYSEVKTWNFDGMMKTVYGILKRETIEGSEIKVNISGGTSEFAAAATIATMMYFPHAELFSMGIDPEYRTLNFKELENSITFEGELVGSSSRVLGPFPISGFPMESPETNLLKQLNVYSKMSIQDRTADKVIYRFIEKGLWTHCIKDSDNPLESTSIDYYQKKLKGAENRWDNRTYAKMRSKEGSLFTTYCIKPWKEKGWIEEHEYIRDKYVVTEVGNTYLDIFCDTP